MSDNLPPGISRDDTVHGEIYYTAAQVRAAVEASRAAVPADMSLPMFVARLENMERNGDTWLTVQAVLALLSDCQYLGSLDVPQPVAQPGITDLENMELPGMWDRSDFEGGATDCTQAKPVAQPGESDDDAKESMNETNAVLARRYFDLLRVVESYEKHGLTCQTFRHFVDFPCAECNSTQAKPEQAAQPMTANQRRAGYETLPIHGQLTFSAFMHGVDVAERHHGIQASPKPKD